MRCLGSLLSVTLVLTGAVWSRDAFDPHTQLEEAMSRRSVRSEPLEAPVAAQDNDGDLTTEEQKKFAEIVELLKVGCNFYTVALKKLNHVRINDLVLSVQQVLDQLKEHQREAYMAVKPQNCPFPEAPKNGGLVCVNVNKIHYCKPMCNQGYDFSFMRRSRLYEECGNHTASKWTTQFIGGSRLAVCIASDVAVSGVTTAYFPTDMKCQKASANSSMEEEQVSTFLQELRAKHVMENHDKSMDAMICGD